MKLFLVLTLAIAFQAPLPASGLAARSTPKVKTVAHYNSSGGDKTDGVTENSTDALVDFVCHPKRPLIEPLIEAGLLSNTSRLPVKLHEKANSVEDPSKKRVHLICKTIVGMQDGEYLCKTRHFDPSSGADEDELLTSLDYELGLDEDDDEYS